MLNCLIYGDGIGMRTTCAEMDGDEDKLSSPCSFLVRMRDTHSRCVRLVMSAVVVSLWWRWFSWCTLPVVDESFVVVAACSCCCCWTMFTCWMPSCRHVGDVTSRLSVSPYDVIEWWWWWRWWCLIDLRPTPHSTIIISTTWLLNWHTKYKAK